MSRAIRRVSLSYPLLLAGLLSGCQAILGIEELGTRPDAGVPADAATPAPDAADPGFVIAVLTTAATVPLDGTNLIDVEVHRSGGFDGEVSIVAKGPPNGLEVTPLAIPPGQDIAQLAVSARTPLTLGQTLSFDLLATAGSLESSATVTDAEITGKPGTLDVAFGAQSTGYAEVSFGADDGGSFHDLEVLPNGNVLAFGWGTGGLGANNFALARLTATGVLDPGFQGGAVVRTNFESGSSGENAQGYAIGRQVDGSIVAIGWHSAGSSFLPDVALAQYTADGAAGNPLFGNYTNGKSRIDLGGDEVVTGGLVLPDNTILAVGRSDERLFLARATPAGDPDMLFAQGGRHILEVAPVSSAEAVITDAGGRILVAGYVESDNRDMVVARYTEIGALDDSFGEGGVVVLGEPTASERAVAIAVRPDGRIVVAGESNANGNVDFQVRQLLDDGTPDHSFGVQGVSALPISDGNDEAEDMLLLPDGRILMVGNTRPGGPIMARYTRTGELDPYFGTGGILEPYLGDAGVARALALYPNQKARVLVAGGDEGATPGPGTFGVVIRMWM